MRNKKKAKKPCSEDHRAKQVLFSFRVRRHDGSLQVFREEGKILRFTPTNLIRATDY